MAKDKKESKYLKQENIGDFLKDLQEEHTHTLEKSYKIHDEFTEDVNLNHFYNDVFKPAHDEMYKKAVDELKNVGEDDEKTEGKKKELKKALAKGLIEYFDKVHPGIKENMEDLDIDDEEEQFDYLAEQFDEHIGADVAKGEGINELVKLYDKGENDETIGGLKKHLDEIRGEYANRAIQKLAQQHYNHHFAQYHQSQFVGYLKGKLEDRGIKIKDKVRFGNLNVQESAIVRNFLKTGRLPKDMKLEQFGLETEELEENNDENEENNDNE